ncbi:hypothetical protein KGF57_003008 [Candida theae]|uniref:Uncharacterized protein n=1 Tax=Candida theae TaxID=1198502 RepID=A0AAD5FY94_9ASCO|nr:uncharacterized protein KGF57_003008 [Candida theae]KAI5957742.1 hypothetical protein KGF57_003008 [Candida theae]
MPYSTGRGGAGNIHHSHEKTSESNTNSNELRDHISPNLSNTPSNGEGEQRPTYYSTGRGGAGNIKRSDQQMSSPKLAPVGSGTPRLTTPKVTTGRGGFGNMVDNKDPELTRKLQDVDDNDGLTKVKSLDLQATNSRGFSVGRGGFGNVISNSRSRSSSEHEQGVPALYSVSSHGAKKNKKKGGFLEKIKEIFA